MTDALSGSLANDSQTDPVQQRYFYSMGELAVGGRCKCNGHASRCTYDKMGKVRREVDSDLEDFYDLVHLRLQAQHDGLRMRAVQAFSLRSALGPGHFQIGQLLRR